VTAGRVAGDAVAELRESLGIILVVRGLGLLAGRRATLALRLGVIDRDPLVEETLVVLVGRAVGDDVLQRRVVLVARGDLGVAQVVEPAPADLAVLLRTGLVVGHRDGIERRDLVVGVAWA